MEKTFKEVVEGLGNKSYSRVELRQKMMFNGKVQDVLIGLFAYDGMAGRIIPVDGDTYSMNMPCEQWKEYKSDKGLCLCVYTSE